VAAVAAALPRAFVGCDFVQSLRVFAFFHRTVSVSVPACFRVFPPHRVCQCSATGLWCLVVLLNSKRPFTEGTDRTRNFGSGIRRFESFLPSQCNFSLVVEGISRFFDSRRVVEKRSTFHPVWCCSAMAFGVSGFILIASNSS
jgi:hypothetical protein